MDEKQSGLARKRARVVRELSRSGSQATAGGSRQYAAAAAVFAIVVMLIGCAILGRAYFDSFFNTALRGAFSANGGAGAAFVMAGLALYLQSTRKRRTARRPARALAAAVALLGGLSLLQQWPGAARWLEPLASILPAQTGSLASVAIQPYIAFGLLLAGFALLGQDARTGGGHYPSEYCAGLLLGMTAVPLLGHAYGVDSMIHLAARADIAIDAALALLLVGGGVLLSRPSHRFMSVITRQAPGGQILRESLPRTLFLLVALNWLIYFGAQKNLYDSAALAPILTLANCALIVLGFWRSAGAVNREYHGRLQSAADLSETMSLLGAVSDNTSDPIYVKNRKGQLVFANPATLRVLGKTREEAMYRLSGELFRSRDEADRIDRDDARIMEERVAATIEQTLHLPAGVRTYTSTKAPWFDASGNVLGIIGISTDITARKQAEDSLKAREAQLEETIARRTATLRRLADHLEMVREEEKRAIARELHDDMGASLTSISMHLEGAYALFPADAQWTGRKEKIQSLLRSVVAITRRIQTELRPTMLDLFGLKAAINELVDDFSQRSGIACAASLPDEDIFIGHKLEITVYRMLQESLNNVVKHARATHVEVILDVDEDRVALAVRDDGIGIAPERRDNPTTYGLRGLQERASFLGGSATVSANKGKGTTIAIELPLAIHESPPLVL